MPATETVRTTPIYVKEQTRFAFRFFGEDSEWFTCVKLASPLRSRPFKCLWVNLFAKISYTIFMIFTPVIFTWNIFNSEKGGPNSWWFPYLDPDTMILQKCLAIFFFAKPLQTLSRISQRHPYTNNTVSVRLLLHP